VPLPALPVLPLVLSVSLWLLLLPVLPALPLVLPAPLLLLPLPVLLVVLPVPVPVCGWHCRWCHCACCCYQWRSGAQHTRRPCWRGGHGRCCL
jgi:hypothetical protein